MALAAARIGFVEYGAVDRNGMVRSLFFILAGLLLLPEAGRAESAAALRRGEALLTRNCAQCHAVGRSGASARADAPALRTLGRRYRIETLEEALAEGLISGHPDMPEFSFGADDVGAIIAYLKAIQER